MLIAQTAYRVIEEKYSIGGIKVKSELKMDIYLAFIITCFILIFYLATHCTW
jgi:hypothetical protein